MDLFCGRLLVYAFSLSLPLDPVCQLMSHVYIQLFLWNIIFRKKTSRETDANIVPLFCVTFALEISYCCLRSELILHTEWRSCRGPICLRPFSFVVSLPTTYVRSRLIKALTAQCLRFQVYVNSLFQKCIKLPYDKEYWWSFQVIWIQV